MYPALDAGCNGAPTLLVLRLQNATLSFLFVTVDGLMHRFQSLHCNTTSACYKVVDNDQMQYNRIYIFPVTPFLQVVI